MGSTGADGGQRVLEAWYMDESDEDQRLPHKLEPNQPCSLEKLRELGVLHWTLNAENAREDAQLETIREERGYNYQDVITCSPACLENYEAKLRMFFEEHLHTDEEVRLCLEGSGYFDVRDHTDNDRWIRIAMKPGDLITLPAGIFHRFTLDETNYIQAMRLFQGEPVWTAHNRTAGAENHECRKQYLNFLSGKRSAEDAENGAENGATKVEGAASAASAAATANGEETKDAEAASDNTRQEAKRQRVEGDEEKA